MIFTLVGRVDGPMLGRLKVTLVRMPELGAAIGNGFSDDFAVIARVTLETVVVAVHPFPYWVDAVADAGIATPSVTVTRVEVTATRLRVFTVTPSV
jgi:hypothetical protein